VAAPNGGGGAITCSARDYAAEFPAEVPLTSLEIAQALAAAVPVG
jgi:hypothetical protein